MKKINLLAVLLFFSITMKAQKHEPIYPQKDRREFQGYTIRLLPAKGGGYGYDIMRVNERVIHQGRNPFSFSSRGLANKEDAFRLAQWQIQQLKSRQSVVVGKGAITQNSRKLPPVLAHRFQIQGTGETLSDQRLSPKIAEQLQISINR